VTAANSCDPKRYSTPAVPIMPLPGNEQAATTALNMRMTGGLTPTQFALQGVFSYLRPYQAAHPDRRVVLVLVTDGFPNNCNNGGIIIGTSTGSPDVMAVAD